MNFGNLQVCIFIWMSLDGSMCVCVYVLTAGRNFLLICICSFLAVGVERVHLIHFIERITIEKYRVSW